jgi:hypothetical protein
MQERQGSADHPRSDEVRGRHDEGYEAGFGDGGLGDRGGFGDQGAGPSAHRGNPEDAGDAPTAPAAPDGGDQAEDSGGYADQAEYGDLPRER